MNWKRILYVVQMFFDMKPKLSYASLDRPVFKGGLQYHWSDQDPDDLCRYAKEAGLHVLTCELAERTAWDQSLSGSYLDFIVKKVAKAKRLMEAARFWKIYVEWVYNNTNADYNRRVSKDDLLAGFDLLVKGCGMQGALYVPASENDKDLDPDKRVSLVAHAKKVVPVPNLVLMINDTGPAAFKEHHIQKSDGLKRGDFRVENCTDSRGILTWLNSDGVDGTSLNEERAAKLALDARSLGTTFELYGFWKSIRDVLGAWKKIGLIYK